MIPQPLRPWHSEESLPRPGCPSKSRTFFTKCSTWRWKKDHQIYHSLRRIPSAKSRELAAAAESGCHRSLPDSLAPIPRRNRRGMGGACGASREEGKVRYIGVSTLAWRADERALKIAPTLLCNHRIRWESAVREGDSTLLQGSQYWRDQHSPMASGFYSPEDDRGKNRRHACDELAPPRSAVQEPRLARKLEAGRLLRRNGNAHHVQPGVVADRMDAAKSCGDGCDCRRAKSRSGRRNPAGRDIPVERRRSRQDRCVRKRESCVRIGATEKSVAPPSARCFLRV